jgi:hypothetical protein
MNLNQVVKMGFRETRVYHFKDRIIYQIPKLYKSELRMISPRIEVNDFNQTITYLLEEPILLHLEESSCGKNLCASVASDGNGKNLR